MQKIFFIPFLLIISMFSLNAQSGKYKAEWKQVDSLINKESLPKSALTIANNIYSKAKKANEGDEMIKALLYRFQLEEKTTENEINDIVNNLNKEIAEAKNPVTKSLLYALKAQSLIDYKNENSWRIRKRSETVNYNKADILTWSADDFNNAIASLFDSSLINSNALKQAQLKDYSAVIQKGNTPELRLSLYDMILHYKVNYYKDNNDLSIKPENVFILNKAEYFAPAEQFTKLKITSEDTASSKLNTVKTYQDILKYYIEKNATSALVDADVQRIEWVYQNAIVADKDTLYVGALRNILNKYAGNQYAKQAAFLLASYYHSQASKYQPYADSVNRWKNVTALEIIEKYLKEKDNTPANISLLSLKQQINDKALTTTTENINSSNKPLRALVEYKNIDEIFVRIIQSNFTEKNNFYDNDEFWKQITSNKNIVQSFSQKLPQPLDYQQHRVEIKIDGLPAGRYILLTSENADFSNDNKLSAQEFDVSVLAYVQNEDDYYVLNRETGHPVANATIHFMIDGNRETPTYKTVITDKDGHAVAPKSNNRYSYGNGYITLGKDRLNINGSYRYYDNTVEKETTTEKFEADNTRIHFFTDRSIYRPGQTVYFKGIVTTTDKETRKTKLYKTTHSNTVILRDVNGKKVDSLKLNTNDYASFSGEFQLPQGLLTGNFSLVDSKGKGNVYFNVEEYKRPTFYVEYDTLKTDYKLNDSITITGYAKAFAGNNIDNAQVKINVTRSARYPYPWLWRSFMPSTPQAQIHNEIVTTDADGNFSFTFKAAPDLNTDKSLKPVFNYQIEASVTDNNGETRQSTTHVSIGYQSLLVNILNEEIINIDSLKEIKISATNLSGQKIPATVTVKAFALEAPARLIRNRYWQRPDQFTMSKTEYLNHFPYDEYDNETEKISWTKTKEVFSKTGSSDDENAFKLNNNNFSTGWYVIEASSKDKDGNEVVDKKYIYVYDANDKQLKEKQYLWTNKQQVVKEIGEKDIFKIGTSAQNVYVLQSKDTNIPGKNTEPVVTSFILNDEIKTIANTTTINDLNPTKYAYGFIKHNRLYTTDNTIMVMDPSKKLNIEYATFRDKTEPGAKEKWQVKITDNTGKNAAAELLTAMYDASLDELRAHNWNPLFNEYRSVPYNNWNTDYQQFMQKGGFENYLEPEIMMGKEKIYSRFIFENNYTREFIGITNQIIGGVRTMAVADMAVAESSAARSKGYMAGVPMPAPNAEDAQATTDSVTVSQNQTPTNTQVPLRSNFNETAFFMPHVYADKDGLYTVEFTMPDAMTKWKWMNFAYNTALQYAYSERFAVTQKKLMVQPNMPRFLRAGDTLDLSVKISNLSDKVLNGNTTISLEDAITGETISWQQLFATGFTVNAGQSTNVKFPLVIPSTAMNPLTIKVSGASENFSDGEQHTIPMLTNKIFVTEALPMFIQGDTTANFTFDKLKNNNSNTLQTQGLTVEFTANPVWYAVQALPYLMEYPYECSEQTFSKFYANALATHIVNQHPRIKNIFNQWLKDSTALMSNLQKNEELKQVLLEETPWVLDAENEAEQKRNIALLFDMAKMSSQLESTLTKLQQMQLSNGSFAWFKGGRADRYITQYIVTGIGRLLKLNAVPQQSKNMLNAIAGKARSYLSQELTNDYTKLKRDVKAAELLNDHTGVTQIHYLFANSYFNALPKTEAEKYYYGQVKKYWKNKSSYSKGMITSTLYRATDKEFAQNTVLKSLLENAVEDKVAGTYWKDMSYGYYWHQAPIEHQALMIEITNEIAEKENNTTLKNSVNGMQNWLIRNKQTNNWKTTKATADASYALISVNNLLNVNKTVKINLGNQIQFTTQGGQAGTDYIKEKINGDKVTKDMGNISVTATSAQHNSYDRTPAYGSVYWQYIEEMDKVTSAATPLSLTKQLFTESNTPQGKKLNPVNQGEQLKVGDKVIIRVVLKSDRDMEYLHLKDMRASAMEPVNVISRYKWQDGLGYYEATKDASTNFFIDFLPKGTYVFEYPVHITHTGDFSVGVASIQCMYAPEFTSHSEGIRIKVK